MAKEEIYVSVDIEADGPIPGINSMLNFGMAAFRLGSEEPIDTFEVNLKPLPGAGQDKRCMDEFWAKNPAAWAYVQKGAVDAKTGMGKAHGWLTLLPGKPVMVIYPTYDFLFMRWYLVRFCGEDNAKVLGIAALDIKTLAFAAMRHHSFRNTSKRVMSKLHPDWFKGHPPHDHTGLSDAIGQGMLFIRVMKFLHEQDPKLVVANSIGTVNM